MKKKKIYVGPVTFPTIVFLGPKVESNVVSIVQFFVLITNLALDLPYIAYFGGKSTLKFGLPALFERQSFEYGPFFRKFFSLFQNQNEILQR